VRALRELTVPAPVLDQLEEERVLEFEGVRDAGEVVIRVATAVGNQPRISSKLFFI